MLSAYVSQIHVMKTMTMMINYTKEASFLSYTCASRDIHGVKNMKPIRKRLSNISMAYCKTFYDGLKSGEMTTERSAR